MKLKTLLLILIVILAIFAVGFLIKEGENISEPNEEEPSIPEPTNGSDQEKIENFFDCLEAGYPVMESYPRQCQAPDGQVFVEVIGNELEKIDLIRIDNPRPNQEIESPLIIEGEARGTWFFEGDFPVVLTDWDGLIIAETYATAQSDWMTEEFVRFRAEIEFTKPELYNRGSLILQKDNPSGLPENDDALEIPIFFK